MNRFFKPLALAAAAVAMLAGASAAMAAGTPSGTPISNTATVNFAVGGVTQTPVVATSPSFLVDTKVSMTVVPAGGAGSVVNVISGAVKQVIPYQVTNTGNLVNDFLLATANLASGTTFGSPTSYTDNFEASSCGVFVDSNGNSSYDAADTAVYIDELAPDASRRVFVVCDIPASRVNADFSAVNLTATAASGGAANSQGAALAATTGAKALNTVAVVLADVAGSDDLANDGKVSARSGFLVQTAALTVTKAVGAYCDPVTFNSNPKLVPGAYARYTITLANSATASTSATLGEVADTLVTQLGFDANLINASASSCATPTSAAGKGVRVSCTGGTRACATTPIYLDTSTTVTGQNISVDLGTVLPVEAGYTAGQLKPGESVQVIFNAIVQ